MPICTLSNVTGDGMKGFNAELKKMLVSQKYLGESLPESYMDIESLLIAKSSSIYPPILTFSEFSALYQSTQTINHSNSVLSDEELLVCLELLSNYSNVLYYAQLTNGTTKMIILDPHFLLLLFSSFISTKHNFLKNGVFFKKNLPLILDKILFPASHYDYFVNLLMKFGLCAEKLVDDSLFFPLLLSEEIPSDIMEKYSYYESKENDLLRVFQLEKIPLCFFSHLLLKIFLLKVSMNGIWKNGLFF